MNIYQILAARLHRDTDAAQAVAAVEALLAEEATVAIYIEPRCPDCGQPLQSDRQGRVYCECWGRE